VTVLFDVKTMWSQLADSVPVGRQLWLRSSTAFRPESFSPLWRWSASWKNWAWTRAEIQSHDQNFIFQTRCWATKSVPNLKRKSAKAVLNDSPDGKCWCTWLVAADWGLEPIKGFHPSSWRGIRQRQSISHIAIFPGLQEKCGFLDSLRHLVAAFSFTLFYPACISILFFPQHQSVFWG